MFQRKVSVLGATSAVGQSLSLLLKTNPLVHDLTLYSGSTTGNIISAAGVTADLGHICSPVAVSSYSSPEDMPKVLDGADVVLIPACGIPIRSDITDLEQFKVNACIVRDLAAEVGKYAPMAQICIISNSINYTVPIAAEVLKKYGACDPAKLFGVTTLDTDRAKTLAARARNLSPYDVTVNVVGGHSDSTIIPLLSQTGLNFSPEEAKALTERIQAGIEATDPNVGALSMASAGAEFCGSLMRALRGDRGISECSYVSSTLDPTLPYFSSRVELGRSGVAKIHPIGKLSPYEEELKHVAQVQLRKEIQMGIQFSTM